MQDHTHPESEEPESSSPSDDGVGGQLPADESPLEETLETAEQSSGENPARSSVDSDGLPINGGSRSDTDDEASTDTDQSPLETLRHVVERRLNSVIEVETQLRADVVRLNTRLKPMFQTFDRLAPVLALQEPAVVAVLTAAQEEVASLVSQIEGMQTAVAHELHFRNEFSEAALGRWQSYRRLTADPLDNWSRQMGEQHVRTQQLAAQLQSRVEHHEERWSSAIVPAQPAELSAPESAGNELPANEPAASTTADSTAEDSAAADGSPNALAEGGSKVSLEQSSPLIPDEN